MKQRADFSEKIGVICAIPSVIEVAFVDTEEEEIKSCLKRIEKYVPYQALIKGYLLDSQRLFVDFGYVYELDEVFVDGWPSQYYM